MYLNRFLLTLIALLMFNACWHVNEEIHEEETQPLIFFLATADSLDAVIDQTLYIPVGEAIPLYAYSAVSEEIASCSPLQIFNEEGTLLGEERFTSLPPSKDIHNSYGSVSFPEIGIYTVIATVESNNSDFLPENDTITINVGALPVLSDSALVAENISVSAGKPLTISMGATEGVTFEWFHADTLMADTYESTLTVAEATTKESGEYYCKVSNEWGSIVSGMKTVTVLENHIPVWKPLQVNQIEEGGKKEIDLTLFCSDKDSSDLISFSIDSNTTCDWAIIEESNKLVLHPGHKSSGIYTLSIIASDSKVAVTYTCKIEVNETETKPQIIKHVEISTPEDSSIVLTTDMLTIEDDDGDTIFTLTVLDGEGYSHLDNEVTPAGNWSGILKITAEVIDESDTKSDPFQISVTVTPVNDQPVITGLVAPITVIEDSVFQLNSGMFTIEDPDSNEAHTLILVEPEEGANYLVDGTTITPSLHFNGDLVVPVRILDKEGMASEIFNTKITVTSVIDGPIISGSGTQVLTVAEDESLVIDPTKLVITDYEGNTEFTITLAGDDNCLVDGTTVKPNANFNGNLSISVVATAKGGTIPSAAYPLVITVTPVNDKPKILSNQPITVNEDSSVILTTEPLTIEDVDEETEFTIKALPGENYTVKNSAEIIPTENFNGKLSVNIQAKDSSELSDVYELDITVTPVNDVPEIVGLKNPLSVDEDSVITLTPDMFIIEDDDDSEFTLVLSESGNYTVLSGTELNPMKDFNGNVTVKIKANDGKALSNIFTFNIHVKPVNDKPEWIGNIPEIILDEKSSKELDLTPLGKDIDGTYSFKLRETAPQWITIEATTNKMVLTPGFADAGKYTVPIILTDGIIESSKDISISINNINREPKLILPSTFELGIGNSSTIPFTIEDPDTDDSWTITTNDPEITISDNTITWTVPMDAKVKSMKSIEFKLSDGHSTYTTSMNKHVLKHSWKLLVDDIDSIVGLTAKNDSTFYIVTPDYLLTKYIDTSFCSSTPIKVNEDILSINRIVMYKDLLYYNYEWMLHTLRRLGYGTVPVESPENAVYTSTGVAFTDFTVARENNHFFKYEKDINQGKATFNLFDPINSDNNPSPESLGNVFDIEAAFTGTNVFVCSDSGIYHKVDADGIWTRIESNSYTDVEIASNDGNIAYFISQGGFLALTTNGTDDEFTVEHTEILYHAISSVVAINDKIAWALKEDGSVIYTSNRFKNYTTVIEEIDGKEIREIVQAEDRSTIYAITTDNKVYKY